LFRGKDANSGLTSGFSNMAMPLCIKSLRIPGKKKKITKMDHPPYSSNLGSCDFWLSLKLKYALKKQRFADIPDIQCSGMLLRGILENDFQDSGSGTIVSQSA
jgi:hypothetical protein